jgi:hypothetical protein
MRSPDGTRLAFKLRLAQLITPLQESAVLSRHRHEFYRVLVEYYLAIFLHISCPCKKFHGKDTNFMIKNREK